MINQEDITHIQKAVAEFFEKMAVTLSAVTVEPQDSVDIKKEANGEAFDVVIISLQCDDPQLFIGEKGQMLFELQRILRIILNRKLQKRFYVTLDINDYQKSKLEYLKKLAEDCAREVVETKQEKILPAMSAYERRIIHEILSNRQDVATQSRGEGSERVVVISPLS